MRAKSCVTRYRRLTSQSPTGTRLCAVPDRELQLVLTGQHCGLPRGPAGRDEELGVGARVHHLGHVTAHALASLHRWSQALVFPSLYAGLGARPLKVMACGCPVACSDAASVPEVCGDAALRFDP